MGTPRLRYPNPGEERSGNPHPSHFKFPELVEGSTLRKHLRPTVKYFLRKNRFGTELWSSTARIAAACGVHRTTVQRNIDELLRELHDCARCLTRDTLDENGRCRKCETEFRAAESAAHRWNKSLPLRPEPAIAPTGLRILEEISPANSWVRYRGSLTFRPTATYRFNPFALRPRKTDDEWARERDESRARHQREKRGTETSAPRPDPPAPAPASTQGHRGNARAEGPRHLTPRQLAKFTLSWQEYRYGHTRDEFGHKLVIADERYIAPMTQEDALLAACRQWNYPVDSARKTLIESKIWKGEDP